MASSDPKSSQRAVPGPGDARFPILFTSVGRRVELVGLFRAAAERLGLAPVLIGANASPLAAALHFCDIAELVPPVTDRPYPDILIELVRRHQVRLVVPLIDTELDIHARLRPALEAEGAVALISSQDAISMTADKYETWRFFVGAGVPAPLVALPDGAPDRSPDGPSIADVGLPAVVKPRRGSASQDVYVVRTAAERDLRLGQVADAMVQQLAPGKELTLDVLTDLGGSLINVVVRERIATRGGESTIGVTVTRPDVVERAATIVDALKPRGPITIQCFSDADTDALLFTEINPRFGGGYPLAEAAGANYPELVLKMCLGEPVAPDVGAYRAGLAMSRYDRSVFFAIGDGSACPTSFSSEDR